MLRYHAAVRAKLLFAAPPRLAKVLRDGLTVCAMLANEQPASNKRRNEKVPRKTFCK